MAHEVLFKLQHPDVYGDVTDQVIEAIEQLEDGLKWMLQNWSVLMLYLDEQGVVDELNRLRTLVGLEPNVTLADLSA